MNVAAESEGVGPSLRRLREAQGWSMSDVSARLKFSVRQIDALENERWDDLPKGLSLRGLVRSYARMLGADADALLAALAPHIDTVATRRDALLSETSQQPLYQEPQTGASLGWTVVILAVLGVVVAYGFMRGWLPQEWLPAGWLAGAQA